MNETKCFICEPDGTEYFYRCNRCNDSWTASAECKFYIRTPSVKVSELDLYYGRFVTRIWTERFFTPGT